MITTTATARLLWTVTTDGHTRSLFALDGFHTLTRLVSATGITDEPETVRASFVLASCLPEGPKFGSLSTYAEVGIFSTNETGTVGTGTCLAIVPDETDGPATLAGFGFTLA